MEFINSLHQLEVNVFEAFDNGVITEHERNMLIDVVKAKEESHKAYLESVKNSIHEITEKLTKK